MNGSREVHLSTPEGTVAVEWRDDLTLGALLAEALLRTDQYHPHPRLVTPDGDALAPERTLGDVPDTDDVVELTVDTGDTAEGALP